MKVTIGKIEFDVEIGWEDRNPVIEGVWIGEGGNARELSELLSDQTLNQIYEIISLVGIDRQAEEDCFRYHEWKENQL